MDETVNDCALENRHIWSAEQVNKLKVHGTASYVLDFGAWEAWEAWEACEVERSQWRRAIWRW